MDKQLIRTNLKANIERLNRMLETTTYQLKPWGHSTDNPHAFKVYDESISTVIAGLIVFVKFDTGSENEVVARIDCWKEFNQADQRESISVNEKQPNDFVEYLTRKSNEYVTAFVKKDFYVIGKHYKGHLCSRMLYPQFNSGDYIDVVYIGSFLKQDMFKLIFPNGIEKIVTSDLFSSIE